MTGLAHPSRREATWGLRGRWLFWLSFRNNMLYIYIAYKTIFHVKCGRIQLNSNVHVLFNGFYQGYSLAIWVFE